MDRQATGKLPDKEVISRVLQGEKQLYEILMRRYNQTLFRAVRSYLHDQEDVEDAMQEAYMTAFQKLTQFKGEAAFSTWLVRIGINEALQRLRRARSRNSHLDNDILEERLNQLPDTQQMDPEERTIQMEDRRILEQAIDRLPAPYRVVYMLREVEGLSGAEAAQCLDITEGNVKVRLHRAKTMMKDDLWKLHAASPAFEFGTTHCDQLVQAVMARV